MHVNDGRRAGAKWRRIGGIPGERRVILSRRGSDCTGTAGLGHGYATRPFGTWATPDSNDDEQMDQDDDHMEGKGDKSNGLDLGALERD